MNQLAQLIRFHLLGTKMFVDPIRFCDMVYFIVSLYNKIIMVLFDMMVALWVDIGKHALVAGTWICHE
jgi:hypothetical protein